MTQPAAAHGKHGLVRAVLRNASAEVTLDVYSDLFDDDLDDAAMRLDHAALP